MKLTIIVCGLIYAPVTLTMERGESFKPRQKPRILKASASAPNLTAVEKGQAVSPPKRPRKARMGSKQSSYSNLLLNRPLETTITLSHIGAIKDYREFTVQELAGTVMKIYNLPADEDLKTRMERSIEILGADKIDQLQLYCNSRKNTEDPVDGIRNITSMLVASALEDGHIEEKRELEKKLDHEKRTTKWIAGISCGFVSVYTVAIGVVAYAWIHN